MLLLARMPHNIEVRHGIFSVDPASTMSRTSTINGKFGDVKDEKWKTCALQSLLISISRLSSYFSYCRWKEKHAVIKWLMALFGCVLCVGVSSCDVLCGFVLVLLYRYVI